MPRARQIHMQQEQRQERLGNLQPNLHWPMPSAALLLLALQALRQHQQLLGDDLQWQLQQAMQGRQGRKARRLPAQAEQAAQAALLQTVASLQSQQAEM
jgi:hypothetical protein